MKLKALTTKDIHLISSMTQNSITRMDLAVFKENLFDLFITRFCWEDKAEHKVNLRVNSYLIFHNINEVKVKGNIAINKFIEIHAILNIHKDLFKIVCSHDVEIFLSGKKIEIELQDISKKWRVNSPKFT